MVNQLSCQGKQIIKGENDTHIYLSCIYLIALNKKRKYSTICEYLPNQKIICSWWKKVKSISKMQPMILKIVNLYFTIYPMSSDLDLPDTFSHSSSSSLVDKFQEIKDNIPLTEILFEIIASSEYSNLLYEAFQLFFSQIIAKNSKILEIFLQNIISFDIPSRNNNDECIIRQLLDLFIVCLETDSFDDPEYLLNENFISKHAKFPQGWQEENKGSTLLNSLMMAIEEFSNLELYFKSLKLIGKLCIKSETLAERLIPQIPFLPSFSNHELSIYSISLICDILTLYPNLQTLKIEESTSLLSFISELVFDEESELLQKISCVCLTRLLLSEKSGDSTENLLCLLVEKYCSDTENQSKNKTSGTLHTIHSFFKLYHNNKTEHQEEIANAIVFLAIEKAEKGVLWSKKQSQELNLFRVQIMFLISMLQERAIPVVAESIQTNLAHCLGKQISYAKARNILGLSQPKKRNN